MTNNVDLNGRQPDALIEIQVTGEVLPPSGSEGNILARRNGKNAWTDPSDLSLVAVKTSASVGQTIVVKAVDADGKPIEWETADTSSGGAVSSVNGKTGDVVLVASDIKHADGASTEEKVAQLTEEIAFNFEKCGLPVLYLNGDTTGMTKDDAVDLAYVYGDMSGTASVKWQGSSSVDLGKKYGKFNYTIKFDKAFEAKEGWGEQKKYCIKANWMDASHARNLMGAKMWGKMCAARSVVNADLQACPNWGAVDGFPIVVALNGKFIGLYTFNIPKDGWMLNMGSGNREAILCAEEGDSCYFKAPATLDGDFEIEYASDENDTGWIKESLNRLINACINSNGSDIDTVIAQYLDIDSAIDYMIHVCVTGNPDNLDRNYILSTKDGVKWTITAYDMDMGFGIGWAGDGFLSAWDYPSFYDFGRLHRLMYLLYTYKADVVKARYKALRQGVLSEVQMQKMVLDYASKIPLYVRNAEANRWPLVPNSGANTVYQIIDYLRLRLPKWDAEVENMKQQSPTAAPMLKWKNVWYDETAAGATQDTIESVAFASSYSVTGSEDASWACDDTSTGSIMAYRNGTDVTIAPTNGATRIKINPNSNYMFANNGSAMFGNFVSLARISGTEMLVADEGTEAQEICKGNTYLTTPIHIPHGVTNLKKAFQGCTALLTPPMIPEGVTIMDNTVLGCTAMTKIPDIPSTVTSLNYAFQNCAGVTDVNGCVIPAGVTDMIAAFYNCNNMSGTIEVNAQALSNYGNAFQHVATTAGCAVTLTGSCPLLAQLAATNTTGNVTVA